MDEYFRKAEQKLSEASSLVDIKRAVSGLFLDLFKDRPLIVAHMSKVMMRTLDRGEGLEGKRHLAGILIRSVQSELSKSH